MKLSEAIRLGAMAIPPTHGPIFKRKHRNDGQGVICGACVIGTILYALMGQDAAAAIASVDESPTQVIERIIVGRWPWTKGTVSVGALISKWEPYGCQNLTREQIADWIATIEPADEPQAEDAVREDVPHDISLTIRA